MERIVNIDVENPPKGVYLATSGDVRGLVARGRTGAETLEIARDVTRKLIEAKGAACSAMPWILGHDRPLEPSVAHDRSPLKALWQTLGQDHLKYVQRPTYPRPDMR